jgi:hypothetical protein
MYWILFFMFACACVSVGRTKNIRWMRNTGYVLLIALAVQQLTALAYVLAIGA